MPNRFPRLSTPEPLALPRQLTARMRLHIPLPLAEVMCLVAFGLAIALA